ncbi:MAG: hypothetical protein HN534_01825 [Euryarchaeota archaeon]|nr:hypothetical protein [Euryarchaeota archaeon]MBT3653659.1 hypothetical protein [Euryarchaeota archaeon]MBT3757866.1 hypothetical protein [Euryarchaeota archaeon]MBT4051028.1 hypothetical protein [Euryarchaeota archaeon]MBT4346263.1 hypothetical protein [Euryarchaeota archaeon]
MKDGFQKKSVALFLNTCLMTPIFAVVIAILVVPAASADSSCQVPASNDWDIYTSVSTHRVGQTSWFDNWETFDDEGNSQSPVALSRDLSVEMELKNDSGQALSMYLSTGFSYTFCITFSPDSSNPPLKGSEGDVYLLSSANWDRYNADYDMRNEDWSDFLDLKTIPVEWRDMIMWLPFRDVHAYEDRQTVEFSVAIDTEGSVWKTGWYNANPMYYLVFDNWDNTRHTDASTAGGDMNVEVLIDVEKRLTLPKFTAYILISILPLSCLIIPMVLHNRYHAFGLDESAEEVISVPLLEQHEGEAEKLED